MPHGFVRPFHFWCQKVLPLVFDDSLSYYEVLAKMRDCLNNAIVEINSIGGEFENVKTQLTQLKTYVDEYFAELDVNQAISDKLDDMVESGEMDAVITPIFAAYANPLFAASVADMIATNFAYANYENNKIYTYNQSTGLYQTTGKEFGGVVSSVDEMEDNDKYYALDSDGMLYSYDFPRSAFVASGLTYGGYRYGVNAMRPIANTYVLTTDNHVYTWNGSEYMDTGVVYGLSNTAFIWRRKLTSEDDVTTLTMDGWYSFDENNLPNGLPVNMSISDGFIIVCSLPNSIADSDNILTSNADTLDTQRSERIRADSRNKRIVLKTNNGGSWFWNGNAWANDAINGFEACDNCNNVNYTSVCYCNNATNSPENGNGLLLTFAENSVIKQVYLGNSKVYYRIDGMEWVAVAKESDLIATTTALQELTNRFYLHELLNKASLSLISDNITTNQLIAENNHKENANAIAGIFSMIANLTQAKYSTICGEDSAEITCENSITINVTVLTTKTDSTLTQSTLPANAKEVGLRFNTVNANANSMSIKLAETNNKVDRFANAINDIETSVKAVTTVIPIPIKAEQEFLIADEHYRVISGYEIAPKTDKTLTQSNAIADAKATGERLEELETRTGELVAISSDLVGFADFSITTQNNLTITSENNATITMAKLSVKTDKTLTQPNAIADAKATGERLEELETRTAELVAISSDLAGFADFSITTQNNLTITSENNATITIAKLSVKTDKTLTQPNAIADAKATGERLEELTPNPINYNIIKGAIPGLEINNYTICLRGTLPETKTNVTINCTIYHGNDIIYDGQCKLKVQGSSSLNNPEKNYTMTLEHDVEMMFLHTQNGGHTYRRYRTNKWNLKCNYIDPSQIRNLLGARLWFGMNTDKINSRFNLTLTDESSREIITENSETITSTTTTNPICLSPYFGCSDGNICYVTHEGKFHGVYTIQLPKDPYMLGMNTSTTGQFAVSAEEWDFRHLSTMSDFYSNISVEERTPDMTDSVIYSKLNNWIDSLLSMSRAELLAQNRVDLTLLMRYIIFVRYANHFDGIIKNIILYSFDGGETINLSCWDMDCIFGNSWYPAWAYTPYAQIRTPLTDNALFAHIIRTMPSDINAEKANMSRYLCQAYLWELVHGLTTNASQYMFIEDFKRWGTKGKTLWYSPDSILHWAKEHEPLGLADF